MLFDIIFGTERQETMIRINGNIVGGNISGRDIIISNNRVIVNGKDVTPDAKEINITVEGAVDKLEVDACNSLKINGNCGSVKTTSGDVDLTGDITGSVQTTSGDVEAGGSIGGSVSTTSGDIKSRK